jgi:PAS domain S-box-containing protein
MGTNVGLPGSRILTLAVAAFVGLAAGLTLLVWLAHLDVVLRVPASFPNANSSLALLLAAASLLFTDAWHSAGWKRTVSGLLAIACLAVAGASAAEWLFGIDLGIDQAMVRDGTLTSAFPGRPTLLGSVGLTLLAIGILADAVSQRLGRLRDVTALVTIVIGFVSIASLITGVGAFGSAAQITPASVLTALGIVLCAMAVLVTGHPESAGLLMRRGPAGSLGRALLFASICLPLVLGGIARVAEAERVVAPNVALVLVIVGIMTVGVLVAVKAATITGRHLNELAVAATALLASEQRQRVLIENVPQAIIFKDLNGVMVSANQAVRTQLGMEPEALIGKRLSDIASPEIAEQYEAYERTVLETREPLVVINELPLPTGLRSVEVRNIPALDEAGRVVGTLLMVTDVTAQRKNEVSQGLLAAIVNSADDAITSGDTDGRFTSWNAGAERLYGWTAEEAIGAPRSLFVPPDLMGQSEAMTDAVATSGVIHVETVRIARDGRRIDVSMAMSSIVDGHGTVTGFSVIGRDITDQKRAQLELERTRQELERSNRELQDFASIASHDLQEPLRKIRAFGDRLDRRVGETLDADSRDDIVRIQGAAARMQQLIEDLLTYARVTSRAQPFVPVDLAKTASAVLEDLETSISESGGQVVVNALPTLDADASQMRQLFQNLIGNGLKFHPPERAPIVTVSAEATEVPGTGGTLQPGWQIEVSDNGIGFEQRFADRIFAPFERLHSRAEFPGTGIGLAICRKICERHGGTISVTSTPGSGTTFHVRLPAAHDAIAVPLPPPPVAATAPPTEVPA